MTKKNTAGNGTASVFISSAEDLDNKVDGNSTDWKGIEDLMTDTSDAAAVTVKAKTLVKNDNKVWAALAEMMKNPAAYDLESPVSAKTLVDTLNQLEKTKDGAENHPFRVWYDGKYKGNERVAYIRQGDKTFDAILSYSALVKGTLEERFSVMHIKNETSLGDKAVRGWFYEQTGEVLNYNRANISSEDKAYLYGGGAVMIGMLGALVSACMLVLEAPATAYPIVWYTCGGLYAALIGGLTYFHEREEYKDKKEKERNNAMAIAALRKKNKLYEGEDLKDLITKMDEQVINSNMTQ